MIDKETDIWKSEPWWVRFFLLGIKKRFHMLLLEYFFLLVGIVSFFLVKPLAIVTPLAFLFAYGNSKMIVYIDEKLYW